MLYFLSTPLAFGLGTIAGTDINNVATVTFNIGGASQSATTNTVTFSVAEILDVNVTLIGGAVTVAPGTSNQDLLFIVSNTGNGNENFTLGINNALGGDGFDPSAATPSAIYFDSDGSGDFSPADIAYEPGNNDPLLAPDASIEILLVNDIPASLADGLNGLSELTARAVTGSGNTGDLYPGDGDGGIDAVVGTTGASSAANGAYIITNVQLSLVKSATINDPFGASEPISGAEITYRIVMTPAGSSTATNTIISDMIPNDTSYVADSLTLNGSELTDAMDGDNGEYIPAPTPQITVMLGDVTQTSGIQTVEFAVTIN